MEAAAVLGSLPASTRFMGCFRLGDRMSILTPFYPMAGRPLPTPREKHPRIYRMKPYATIEVRIKSKFWCFLRNLKVVKRSNFEALATTEREAQNLIGWKEKFIQGVGTLFSCMVVTLMLIISSSGAVRALTENNRLFLEAWRTIDRAYIDKTFNGQSWFRYREYALLTEPMNNREETYMAIKKMVATLNDPFTRFLEPEKFKSLRAVWHSRCTYRCRFIYWLSHWARCTVNRSSCDFSISRWSCRQEWRKTKRCHFGN